MTFLMQQMELREELEDIRGQADPYQAIANLRGRINKQINGLVAQLAVYFETPTEDQLQGAREILRKMRFLQKLHTEAESVEADLEDELN